MITHFDHKSHKLKSEKCTANKKQNNYTMAKTYH